MGMEVFQQKEPKNARRPSNWRSHFGPQNYGRKFYGHHAFFKVARLQSEFCTKDLFSSHEFSYEKCSEIFPEIFEPLFCGSEKIPGKFPPNLPLNFPNFPAKNQKKFTDELLQERRENAFSDFGSMACELPRISLCSTSLGSMACELLTQGVLMQKYPWIDGMRTPDSRAMTNAMQTHWAVTLDP